MSGLHPLLFSQLAASLNAHLHADTAGGAGGEDPSHPHPLKSAHEADAIPTQRKKLCLSAKGPVASCPICHRSFATTKAVHGHMRCHPERTWRGMEAPAPGAPTPTQKLARALPQSKGLEIYRCTHCKSEFVSRQALGGHRASHNGKKGCYSLSREEMLATARARAAAKAAARNSRRMVPMVELDLNIPAPEAEE